MVLSFFMGEFPRIRRGALPVRRSRLSLRDIPGPALVGAASAASSLVPAAASEELAAEAAPTRVERLRRPVTAEAARGARAHHRAPRPVLAYRCPAEVVVVDPHVLQRVLLRLAAVTAVLPP